MIAELLGECGGKSWLSKVPKGMRQEGVSKSTSPNKKKSKGIPLHTFQKKYVTISVAGLEDGSFYGLKAPHPTPLLSEGQYLHGTQGR